LLDVLSGNKPEDAALQSKLLELNLMQAPQVADAILANEMFSHYNRRRVAELAEKAGLFNRALEHYTDMADWKRCIRNAHTMNPDFVVAWFGKIQPADRMACLNEMLTSNLRANITVAVKVAVRYAEELGASALIKMFENYKSTEGVFFFLQQVVDASTEAEVHFKYIEAAAKLGQVKEVERIVRQSNHYEPERVRDFLKEAKLPDQLPLVIVCDKYNFVDDLTNYLFKNQMLQSIEAYVTTINPMNTPIVVGALLDSGCPEDFILQLVNTVGNLCSADQLIEEIEKRNRLKILQSWLETRFREGNQEPALHNAIAKIYVDDRKDAEKFLTSNQFYDSRVVGRYCENRDPFLAFVAYKRGMCDKELIEVTNKHSLFKHQARYLVERQDLALWATVLSNEDSSVRRQLIDQVVQTALPESKKPEEVSCAVKAFMVANLPNELIELLEKIVLDNPNSDFGRNKSLQNLLIVTAIRSHSAENPDRAMSFIKRLDNFETGEVAEIAKEHKLYEEAFAIYSKVGDHVNAVMVLIENVGDLERAYDYADRLNRPDVWTKLGRAQLRQGKVKEAIASFIKGNDPEDYVEVIDAANRADLAEDLIKFLVMARTRVREQRVDSELAYAYAKADRLAELDAFVAGPNVANVQDVADRCFNEGVYEAARLLYSSINNFAKLAVTLLRLQQFGPAVDAARKANSTATWKEVSRACVEAKQFRLAQVAGLAIIVHGDELEEVIRFYENHGHFDELMALIEAGLGLERAHVGMFTELAILYSKYKPAKLMEHLKLWNSRLNIPKVAQACEKNQQWKELSFLYITYDEFDKAVVCMISHSEDAWDHVLLKEIIAKVSNVEHYYKVVRFYFDEHPTMANDLLTSLAAKIDHTRVVLLAREVGQLALIKNYLVNVQDANIPAVNEALAELYIEEEDFAALRASIDSHNNFDAIGLAKKLEKHELLEFRRIAAYLYKKNGRYQQSMDLSKKDKLYQDAMRAAADSDDHEVAENLLAYFVENGDKEAFSACLYICYNLIRPDVALELAWKNKMLDNAFPFIIQVLREYTSKVDKLQAAEDARKAQQEAMQQSQQPPPHVLATMGGPLPPGVIDPTGIPQLFATQVAPPGVMMTGPVGMHPGMMQPPMGHHPHMSFPH
jgi:clathrin heavy chain